MTAKSNSRGHEIVWDENVNWWIYKDTGLICPENEGRPCKHCGKRPTPKVICIPAELSHTGKRRWTCKPIDYCISDIVGSLNKSLLTLTRYSCCGHEEDGEIQLHDGRILIIKRSKNEDKGDK